MKNLTFVFLFLISFTTFSQIEVTRGKFPFNQIVEWPGKGTLLLGDDPTGKSQEINLSLLNHQGEVQWNRSVYPKNKTTHLITSSNSDYIYFVDDLKPENNQIRYNQMNQSGSVSPTKFDMLSVIRSYRYTTPNDLELREIINTPKALVFYFQLPVKDKNIIENFFVTVTHHNNRVYHCQAPSTSMDLVKKGLDEHYVFAGADDEAIYFTRLSNEVGANFVNFFSFSPKAEKLQPTKMRPINFSPMNSEINFIGLTGSYYLQTFTKAKFENRGKGIYFNGSFYYAVNDDGGKNLKVYGQNEKGEFVLLKESAKQANSKKNSSSSVAFIPLKDRLFIVSEIDNNTVAFEISDAGIKETNASSLQLTSLRKNPSSFMSNSDEHTFIHMVNDIPYAMDIKNLEKLGTFVFLKK